MLKRFLISISGVGLALSCASVSAAGETYVFSSSCISSNVAAACAAGASQLKLSVTDLSSRVVFLFENTGPAASSITDVYFDDLPANLITDAGVGNPTIASSTGVSFSEGAHPANLPGGNPLGFSAVFSADSNAPVQPNGVGPGEWLRITYNLTSGSSFTSLVGAMQTGGFRVGMHVQGFAGGKSASFINGPTPIAMVPEPAEWAMMAVGLGMVGLIARRRRRAASMA